jgi:hypothetical protein
MSASDATDAPPRTEPALRAIAMPADANPAGDIFGAVHLCGGGFRAQAVSDTAGRLRPKPG